MYNEFWDVDVNHSDEVYLMQDEVEATEESTEEELPFHIPRD